ncbi:MAG: 2-hydroxyglutaryl-CoA dehydratase, partial [Clostridiales bacterium]|nr:2-hydroxyglutaryl-CoA dehydratase [Clostridiales bacterium]
NIRFSNPFMSFRDEAVISQELIREFPDISPADIKAAVKKAWLELDSAHKDIQKKGEEVMEYLNITGKRGIVLAGRPYHIDPEINHGIPELITSFDIAVLTEDSVSHLANAERPLIVSDQWMYHSRLYAAASYVKLCENLDLIQLNSFGCGLDAVTTDQVNDILSGSGKIYTCLKIDEVNNLGAARIRIRSLLAAIRVKALQNQPRLIQSSAMNRVLFTEEMRKDYTIICPQMSPLHFDLLEAAFNSCGYNFHVLGNDNKHSVDVGLKYVNNDACFPSLMVVGQIMEAIQSGKYDTDKLAVVISQTGGGCRATNYIGFIRRALEKAGYGHIPVISLSFSGLEKNPGFKITVDMLIRAIYAVVFGDLFMRCIYRMRPYEKDAGSVNTLHALWAAKCKKFVSSTHPSFFTFQKMCWEIVEDFDAIPITNVTKPKVGIVGEILVKFLPAANNYLVELLEAEGAEAVCPDLLDFMYYCFYNQIYKSEHLGTSKKSAFYAKLGMKGMDFVRSSAVSALKKSRHFHAPAHIEDLADY